MNIQKRATLIALITALFLAISKFFVGFFSGSIAILSSAIDSLLDMCISLFNVVALNIAEKNPDKNFNYGRWKAESLASFLEWILIAVSWGFIFYSSVIKILNKEAVASLDIGLWMMGVSVVVTLMLVIFLERIYKKTKNLVIQSDALHYKTDLYSNGAILVGFVIMHFTWFYWIDAVLGLIISIYIIICAAKIIKNAYNLLLDVALEEGEVKKILKILKNHREVSTFHELRTRQSGGIKFVEAHVVFRSDILLFDAHRISHELEDMIKEIDKKSQWIIVLHLEPYDDSHEHNEKLLQ